MRTWEDGNYPKPIKFNYSKFLGFEEHFLKMQDILIQRGLQNVWPCTIPHFIPPYSKGLTDGQKIMLCHRSSDNTYKVRNKTVLRVIYPRSYHLSLVQNGDGFKLPGFFLNQIILNDQDF